MFEIKYDGSKAIRGLSLLARSVGMNARVAYYELMRLWINDLIKRTPPRTTKQGKDAIEGDLNKLFVGVDKRPVMEFLADDFKGSEPQGTIINDAGNVGRMRSYHEKHRNSQGRVRRREVKTKLGGINFVNKMYVPGSVLRKYKKTRKSHVGTLKAGWLNAANYYARKSGGRVIAPPWVKKQARRLGSKVDAMRPSGKIGRAHV